VLSLLGLGGVGVVTAKGLSGCELQGGNSSDSSALPSSLDVKVMDMLMVFVGGSVGITGRRLKPKQLSTEGQSHGGGVRTCVGCMLVD